MEKIKNAITFVTFIVLWTLLIMLNVFVFGTKGSLAVYGIVLMVYLSVKMGLSFLYRPYKGQAGQYMWRQLSLPIMKMDNLYLKH